MQDKKMKTKIVILAVPADLLLEAGILEGNPMQMYAGKGKLVIENMADLGDVVCNGDCESCPVSQIDCDGNCAACPCSTGCDESEVD